MPHASGLIGYAPAVACAKDDMILINANKPIDQTDEIREKQIQRRYEQWFFG